MVAVLACSHTRGGRDASATAAPRTRVDSTRESMISLRLAGVYRQLTLRPARLMRTSDPSTSRCQPPRDTPSHVATRHDLPRAESRGLRLSTTTSSPLL